MPGHFITDAIKQMTQIKLIAFESRHLELLHHWLGRDHVTRWFPNPQDDIQWASAVPEQGRQSVICADKQPVGYIRWSYVSREVLDSIGFYDLPAESADIDVLIGDESRLGRGIAVQALEQLVVRLRAEGRARMAALTTSVHNQGAHRAFGRAGFTIDREYEPDGYGRCLLMLREIV